MWVREIWVGVAKIEQRLGLMVGGGVGYFAVVAAEGNRGGGPQGPETGFWWRPDRRPERGAGPFGKLDGWYLR